MDEFMALRDTVVDGMREQRWIGHVRGTPICQLMILPSFEDMVCWDAIDAHVGRQTTEMRLYRTCWLQEVDGEALNSPVERMKHPRPYPPSLEIGSVPIDKDKLQAIVARAIATPVPLAVAEAPLGLDGTNFELAFGHFFCQARLAWWCDLPQEWQALTPLVADLSSLFESTWKRE